MLGLKTCFFHLSVALYGCSLNVSHMYILRRLLRPFPSFANLHFLAKMKQPTDRKLRLGRSSPPASLSSSGSNFSLQRREENAATAPKTKQREIIRGNGDRRKSQQDAPGLEAPPAPGV